MIKLAQYRDPWMAEQFDECIGFYTREFYCLDNFSSFQIEYNGVLYTTVEEAYQALGFIDSAPEVYEKILNLRSAHEAKIIAHEFKEQRRPDWESIKVGIMEELLRAKLYQHPYVRKKLLETKNYPLVEDSPSYNFYGCGSDRSGENTLGKLWEKLRTDLQAQL